MQMPPMNQLMQMMQGSNNPMGMLQNMFGKDPKFGQYMQIVQGKSPQELQQFCQNYAKENNIDLNQVINQMSMR